MKYDLKTYIWNILDILFPPHCAGCEKWGVRFCGECFNSIGVITGPVCYYCGDPISSYNSTICDKCKFSDFMIDQVRSWAYFDGTLQKAVHKLKYRRDLGLSTKLSLPMTSLFEEQSWKVDLIIPVPLHPDRLRNRGYNQASLLAKPISKSTGILFNGKSLFRINKTRSQVGLSLPERMENVSGAFQADPVYVKGQSVLIIDDVITTGSTLKSCAAALKNSGAEKVYGLSLARSLRL